MRITHSNISGKKILNIVGSRTIWRRLWRFDLLLGRCWMFPMTLQCANIDGVVDFAIICFTDIMERLSNTLNYDVILTIRHLGVGLYHLQDGGWAKVVPSAGLLWPLETPIMHIINKRTDSLSLAAKNTELRWFPKVMTFLESVYFCDAELFETALFFLRYFSNYFVKKILRNLLRTS